MSSRFNRMLPSINVLTHACSDVSQPALMIHAKDGKRYIVGRISEGFQRSLGEQKCKSSRLQGIWLTGRLNWANVSGLPGYLLTLADNSILNRIYWGVAQNISQVANSWSFINWHDRLVVEKTNSSQFSDDNFVIHPQLILDSTCYIVQTQPSRGKFLAAKATELGVPKGKMFGQLSLGQSVTLESGRVIFPHQVLEPSPTPTRAVVFDLPTTEHVKEAASVNWQRPLVEKRKRDEDDESDFVLEAAYYFLDKSVDPMSNEMKELLAKLPSKCRHYISHPDLCSDEPCQKSLDVLQQKLNKILPGIFPKMRASPPKTMLLLPFNTKVMHQGDVLSMSKQEYHDEPLGQDNTPAHLLPEIDEPMVTTLGTGASCPSKYRNVSSTVVRIPTGDGIRAVMFDCGEGTAGSLKRLHSPQDLERLLKELDIIYISHMHADHHLGTLELIKQWQNVNPDRTLTIMGSYYLYYFLSRWEAMDAEPCNLNNVRFIELEHFIYGQGYGHMNPPPSVPATASTATATELLQQAGLKEVRSCRARHCDRSYSSSLTYRLPNGKPFTVAYSGDTRPSKYFAHMAKHADLLIHEATHDDELAAEAKAKNHSTVGQAVEVAREMEAGALVLTHFSQRYPKIHATTSVEYPNPVLFGFDGLRFKLSEIPAVQAAMPTIAAVFNDIEEDN